VCTVVPSKALGVGDIFVQLITRMPDGRLANVAQFIYKGEIDDNPTQEMDIVRFVVECLYGRLDRMRSFAMSTHPYEVPEDIIKHLDEMHNGRGYALGKLEQPEEHAHKVHEALHAVEK